MSWSYRFTWNSFNLSAQVYFNQFQMHCLHWTEWINYITSPASYNLSLSIKNFRRKFHFQLNDSKSSSLGAKAAVGRLKSDNSWSNNFQQSDRIHSIYTPIRFLKLTVQRMPIDGETESKLTKKNIGPIIWFSSRRLFDSVHCLIHSSMDFQCNFTGSRHGLFGKEIAFAFNNMILLPQKSNQTVAPFEAPIYLLRSVYRSL